MLKTIIVIAAFLYAATAVMIFVMHTQMPATFALALLRSIFWPMWIAGGLQGTPLPMD